MEEVVALTDGMTCRCALLHHHRAGRARRQRPPPGRLHDALVGQHLVADAHAAVQRPIGRCRNVSLRTSSSERPSGLRISRTPKRSNLPCACSRSAMSAQDGLVVVAQWRGVAEIGLGRELHADDTDAGATGVVEADGGRVEGTELRAMHGRGAGSSRVRGQHSPRRLRPRWARNACAATKLPNRSHASVSTRYCPSSSRQARSSSLSSPTSVASMSRSSA